MVLKTGCCGDTLFTHPHNRAEGQVMSRAFIENGHWRLTAENACDAIVQRKATLRVSVLAGLLTLGLYAGPGLHHAMPEVTMPRAPLVSQPEMVSHKPVDRVPVSAMVASPETTSSAPLRPRLAHRGATDEVIAAAAIETPKAHPPLSVVDGATLQAGDMTVRLAGLSLPAEDTSCRRLDGLSVPCLDRANSYLQLLVKGRTVACDRVGVAADGIETGRCRVGDTDIAEQMVRQGWARTTEASDKRLAVAEAAARKQKLGIWRE
jgi:endonuclease YncB( thermonuclease family)